MHLPGRDGPSREVGTIYGLGRNFAAHAAEMRATTEPVVFIMPRSALLPGGGRVRLPEGSTELHHEVELVLALGRGGANLGPEAADAAIESLALGLDLTARDLQAEAKKKGAPWARSKGFAGAAPISPLQDATAFRGRWGEIDLRCTVEGTLRQQATCAEMIHDPPAVVALLSRWFLLEPGDLIFTGTPAGVGPIRPGQRATAVSRALGEELRVEVT
ncbi:MAG: fumarylacetoacetate hydrolase family protein [Acidobacteriota bacterium]|nr:fumarylacetoacetate hydrolase family protein [Acidobacteriota bacterium]